MKLLINIILYFLIINIFCFGIIFGIDRDLARRDYVKIKNINNTKVTGCIYNYNCDFYNNLLKEIQQ